jgi:hypothetical protein
MNNGQKSVIKTGESIIIVPTEIELNENGGQKEKNNEVIFIRRQFQPPSQLEIRFARLKKALRKRSASII